MNTPPLQTLPVCTLTAEQHAATAAELETSLLTYFVSLVAVDPDACHKCHTTALVELAARDALTRPRYELEPPTGQPVTLADARHPHNPNHPHNK